MQFSRPFYIVIALLFIFSAAFGLFFTWAGLLFAFVGAIFTILLLLVLFIQLVSKNSMTSPLSLLAILWGAQVIGLTANILKPEPAPMLDNPDNPSHQIRYMYNTSLVDQQQIKYFLFESYADNMRERDSIRIYQVMGYLDQNEINEPKQKYHAATILRRGYKSDHFKTGHELAKEAESEDPDLPNITRLKETLHDLWQMKEGRDPDYDTHRLPVPGNI